MDGRNKLTFTFFNHSKVLKWKHVLKVGFLSNEVVSVTPKWPLSNIPSTEKENLQSLSFLKLRIFILHFLFIHVIYARLNI